MVPLGKQYQDFSKFRLSSVPVNMNLLVLVKKERKRGVYFFFLFLQLSGGQTRLMCGKDLEVVCSFIYFDACIHLWGKSMAIFSLLNIYSILKHKVPYLK